MTVSEHLVRRWRAVHGGCGEAIRWIGDVRGSAQRLDNEADDLILNLRRVRNTARRLGEVAGLPMSVGFFGLSQAGKSYLISSLAASANGRLETQLGGRRLDFLDHVNPPGGGKEATGLVTRFSRSAQPGDQDFPLELKLFQEIELVKVLANSFFSDFNQEKLQHSFDEAAIRQLLASLAGRRRSQPLKGLSEDDVVSLWDYLYGSFPGSLKVLNGYYWPQAVRLAPYLSLEDRSRLFAVLWGEIPALTEVYQGLAQTLERLGHPGKVFAPLQVLVTDTAEGGLSQADSIMNVDMLDRLGQDSDRQVAVRPQRHDGLGSEETLSLAELAVLTVELVFPLAEATREALFEQVDLLDFPGYRTRMSLESKDDVARQDSEGSTVAKLLLRGKVAYLFERYTDSQEMNVLIVCTPANQQSEVTSVGQVLDTWIAKTQGATPEARARRKPGLLWAITKFDLRIGDSLGKNEDLLRLGWGQGGLMKAALLERFGNYAWLQDWVPGQAFDNLFLVRKPNMPVAFLDVQAGDERGIHPAQAAQLELMRRTFVEDTVVQRHIAQADEAWDAMLALNDGGMGRISAYLREVARLDVKLGRIAEQLDEVLHPLLSRLGHWFQAEGAGELEKKRAIARQIVEAIQPRRQLLGELLYRMQLPDEQLRALYLRAGEALESPPAGTAGEEIALTSVALNLGSDLADDDFDLFAEPAAETTSPAAAAPTAVTGSDLRFAQAVLRDWISHLRSIPEDTRLLGYLGYAKAAMEALVDELITVASRQDLQGRLVQAIATTEQVGTKREQLAGRQVLVAQTVLNDFIGWLGYIDVALAQRPDSRIRRGHKLFQPAELIAEQALPELPELPPRYTDFYLGDWLAALIKQTEDNAGHSAGREITLEQNEALGRVLATLEQARVD